MSSPSQPQEDSRTFSWWSAEEEEVTGGLRARFLKHIIQPSAITAIFKLIFKSLNFFNFTSFLILNKV